MANDYPLDRFERARSLGIPALLRLRAETLLNRHSPDSRSFCEIFRPVEARCKEIRSVTGCAGGQTVELAAAKGWSASCSLHRGTP